jgi:hypothetical protein
MALYDGWQKADMDGWMYRNHRNNHTRKSSVCYAESASANSLAGFDLIYPEEQMDNYS